MRRDDCWGGGGGCGRLAIMGCTGMLRPKKIGAPFSCQWYVQVSRSGSAFNQDASFVFPLSLQDVSGLQCFTDINERDTILCERYMKCGVPFWSKVVNEMVWVMSPGRSMPVQTSIFRL